MVFQIKDSRIFRWIAILLVVVMVNTIVLPSGFADMAFFFPSPQQRLYPTGVYDPARMIGLKIDRQNPFHFDFIMDRGDELLNSAQKRVVYHELIKDFLTSLTVANKDMWVNLSP